MIDLEETILSAREGWMKLALCQQGDGPAVFAEVHNHGEQRSAALASAENACRAICHGGCPVYEQCLEYSLTQLPYNDKSMWAGMNRSERKRMRMARNIRLSNQRANARSS